MIKSYYVWDTEAALGFLDTDAQASFALISNALQGFFFIIAANFFCFSKTFSNVFEKNKHLNF